MQWVQRLIEEASWEDYDLLAGQFPSFRLADNTSFQGRCTDASFPLTHSPSPPLLTYSRKFNRGKTVRDKADLVHEHVGRVKVSVGSGAH